MSDSPKSRTQPLAFLLATTTLFAIFCLSVLSSLPSNIILDKGEDGKFRQVTLSIFPQGWSFFTKSPADPNISVMTMNEDSSLDHSIMKLPQSKSENLFGISREQRAQGPEIATIANTVPAEEWVDCELDMSMEECAVRFKGSETTRIVLNETTVKTICGEVIIAEVRTPSWAYRDLYETSDQPLRATQVISKC